MPHERIKCFNDCGKEAMSNSHYCSRLCKIEHMGKLGNEIKKYTEKQIETHEFCRNGCGNRLSATCVNGFYCCVACCEEDDNKTKASTHRSCESCNTTLEFLEETNFCSKACQEKKNITVKVINERDALEAINKELRENISDFKEELKEMQAENRAIEISRSDIMDLLKDERIKNHELISRVQKLSEYIINGLIK